MGNSGRWLLAAGVLLLGLSAARAEPVKVGIIGPFSGPAAVFGESWRAAMEAYQAMHGATAGGHEVELIYRDLPGPNPGTAKALAQELIIKDGVQYLGGIVFTPNALAIAPLVQEARIPTVIFNAAGTTLLPKSDYLVRVSYTLPQVAVPAARYAYEDGIRRVVTMVADYAPGADAEAGFVSAFEAAGGTIVEAVRVPLKTTDFAPFAQRVKALAPDAIFTFFPGGAPAYGMLKAYLDNGLREAGIRLIGNAETEEQILPQIGDGTIGLESVHFYSAAHDSDLNRAYVAAFKAGHPDLQANGMSIEGFDGLNVIYAMIAATDGKRDPDAAMSAARGLAWESPRGPVRIDPDSRHIIQNIYIRAVAKDSAGNLVNQEKRTFEAQPDPVLSR